MFVRMFVRMSVIVIVYMVVVIIMVMFMPVRVGMRMRVKPGKCVGHHGGVQVATLAGVDLNGRCARRADAVGIEAGLLIPLNDGQTVVC